MGVEGLGLMAKGLGFSRAFDCLGFRVEGLGSRVQGLRWRVDGLWIPTPMTSGHKGLYIFLAPNYGWEDHQG